MNILIIQGPNLNLLGKKSSQFGENLTLDKINRSIRYHVRNQEIKLKFLQTHKLEAVITSLQRNRNWAKGILAAPMAWGKYEYVLGETLQIIELPVVEIYFSGNYFMGTGKEDSLLSDVCVDSLEGSPEKVFVDGLDSLIHFIKSA